MIGVLTAVLTATAVRTTTAYSKLTSSAANFRHYFRDLKGAGNSLSTVERLVFSLVMANAKPESEPSARSPRT